MSFKFLMPILLLLTVVSCSIENSTADERILGEWGICVEIIGKIQGMCYACPSIRFKEDQSAILIRPSGEEEYYNWSLREDKLILTTQDRNFENTYFKATKHEITIENKKEYLELIMIGRNEHGYILRKRDRVN